MMEAAVTILETPLAVMAARLASARPDSRPELLLGMIAERGGRIQCNGPDGTTFVFLSGILGAGRDLGSAIDEWLSAARGEMRMAAKRAVEDV